jgi:hypothetical protein
MKYILTAILILSYAGAIIASIFITISKNNLAFLLIPIIVISINVLCALYINKTAKKNKTEWILLALIGNINALLLYWLVTGISKLKSIKNI